jgi:hypothetical protein
VALLSLQWLCRQPERNPKPGTSKLHGLIFYPTYLHHKSSYIEFENGVEIAAKCSTT